MLNGSRRRSARGGALQIVLIVLAALLLLALLAVGAAYWVLRNYVRIEVERAGDAQRVAINTPIGEFTIEKAEDAAAKLKLPVYPGAAATDESVSLKMRADVEGEEAGGFELTAAQFRTSDPLDKVDAWYRRQLGPEFVREQGKLVWRDPAGSHDDWVIPKMEPGGNDVVFRHEKKDDFLRGVALQRRGGRVRIGLFEVRQAARQ